MESECGWALNRETGQEHGSAQAARRLAQNELHRESQATRGTTRGMVAPAGLRYAALCQARGDHVGAVRLRGACSSISRAWDPYFYSGAAIRREQIMQAARLVLGEEAFARATAAGQSLTPEEAIIDVLGSEAFR